MAPNHTRREPQHIRAAKIERMRSFDDGHMFAPRSFINCLDKLREQEVDRTRLVSRNRTSLPRGVSLQPQVSHHITLDE
jgi:hypothetical protein